MYILQNIPDLFLLVFLLQLEAGRNFETCIVEYLRPPALFKHSKYSIQAVLKKEAFNLVVSDKISYTREVGSYSNLKRRVG